MRWRAAWVGFLRLTYGVWPFLPASGNFGRPFAAFVQCLPASGSHRTTTQTITHAACLALVAAQMVLALYLARRPGDPVLRLFLLAGFTLAALAGTAIYEDKWSFTRVLAWLPLAAWLACVEQQRRRLLALLALPALIPVGVVVKAWMPF
jgi:hypothetical protein